jgi:hypothetical protein
MEIDRQLIVDYLNNRGDHDKAVRAGTELPPIVDTDRESGLLGELDVQPEDLAGGHPPGPAGQGVVRDMDALDAQPEDLAGGHPPGPAGLGVVGDPDD